MAKTTRRAVDEVLIFLGIVTTVVLIAFGAIAWYGYHFASNTVRDELTSQQIFFPSKGSPAIAALPAADQTQMNKYAGQQLVNGDQAKVYANNFIAVHLSEVAGGQTYAEISTKALANPTDQKLQVQKSTLFQGETLRGLLLGDGYAYWTFGKIAKIASVASFAGAAVMFILVLLGLGHLNRSRR